MGFNSASVMNCGIAPARVIATRQATYPFWGDNTINQGGGAAGFVFGHTATWNAVGASASNYSHYHITDLVAVTKVGDPVNALYPQLVKQLTSSYHTFASFPPVIGLDGDLPWIYLPAGCTVAWGVGLGINPTQSIFYDMFLEEWLGPGQFQLLPKITSSITSAGGEFGFVTPFVSTGGWYRPRQLNFTLPLTPSFTDDVSITVVYASQPMTFVGNLATKGVFTIQSPPAGAQTLLLPLAFPVEYFNSPLPWKSVRTTASASLLTNTTKALNKEGTALWSRVAPQISNPWTITYGQLNNAHPSEKAFMGLENGCYTYVAPTTDLQLFMQYDHDLSVGSVPVYRLDNTALVNVGFLVDPDGGTNMAINTDWHIEFRTMSALFQIAMSPVPLESLHQAQILLATAGFFYPNVSHVAILTALTAAWRTLRPYISAGVRGAAQGVSRAIAARNPPIVQPTTLATTVAPRSGGLQQSKRKKKARVQRQQRKAPQPKMSRQTPKLKSGLDMYLNSRR